MVLTYYTTEYMPAGVTNRRSLRDFDYTVVQRGRRAQSEMPHFQHVIQTKADTLSLLGRRRAPSVFSPPVTTTTHIVERLPATRTYYTVPKYVETPTTVTKTYYAAPNGTEVRNGLSVPLRRHYSVSDLYGGYNPSSQWPYYTGRGYPYSVLPYASGYPFNWMPNALSYSGTSSYRASPSYYVAHASPKTYFYPTTPLTSVVPAAPSFLNYALSPYSGYHHNTPYYNYGGRLPYANGYAFPWSYYNGLNNISKVPAINNVSYWPSTSSAILPALMAPQSVVVNTVSEQRKRIEKSLNSSDSKDVGSVPSSDYFLSMHQSLRDLNDKLMTHRLLLDRYAGIDLSPRQSVAVNIDDKYRQLAARIPQLESYSGKPKYRSSSEAPYVPKNYSSEFTLTGVESNKGTVDLRHRIRRLICKTRNNPHYY